MNPQSTPAKTRRNNRISKSVVRRLNLVLSKPPIPSIAHTKCRGEWAEIVFLARVFALGFNACKPWGDCAPYDWIIERGGHMFRVNVKSAWWSQTGSYQFSTHSNAGGNKRATYSASAVDFLACWVVPMDLWYILPVSAIRRDQQRLHVYPAPELLRSHPAAEEWERFRERWDLLR